jgi:hypothetical protein
MASLGLVVVSLAVVTIRSVVTSIPVVKSKKKLHNKPLYSVLKAPSSPFSATIISVFERSLVHNFF